MPFEVTSAAIRIKEVELKGVFLTMSKQSNISSSILILVVILCVFAKKIGLSVSYMDMNLT